jgi:hypothetical protein
MCSRAIAISFTGTKRIRCPFTHKLSLSPMHGARPPAMSGRSLVMTSHAVNSGRVLAAIASASIE